MDIDAFWDITEAARARTGPGQPFDEALTGCLATRTQQDIQAYQEQFDQVHAALYRWDLWAVAYLIGGGCSDDGFIDFRAGLIAQGREWSEKAAASPDSLADHPAVAEAAGGSADNPLFYEAVSYAAPRAFGQPGGEEGFYAAWIRFRGPRDQRGHDAVDMGEDFDFDDPDQMHRRLPRLAALFLADGPRHSRRLLGP
ncbi:MAG: DUF4240 domain-containing protein [Streptosporangiaceae bacterium]